MRLFITSYQKSGTHQSYPMFMPDCPSIVDRSGVSNKGMDDWGFNSGNYPLPRMSETIAELESFNKHGRNHVRAFGHVAYLPEYAKAVQTAPTKVVFNVRDPRDVIVAEIARIKMWEAEDRIQFAWLNYKRESDDKRINEIADPIAEMIMIAAAKWKNWIGWLDHDFVTRLQFEELRLRPLETANWLTEQLKPVVLPKSPPQMVEAAAAGRKPGSLTPSFRKGKVGEWKSLFKAHHKKLAYELMGEIIERLGYEI